MTRTGAAARGATIAVSRARPAAAMRFMLWLLPSYAEQQFDRQLIEALVSKAPLSPRAELGDDRLDVGVGVPLPRALFQDQVRAHASACEIADAVVILGPVGVGIEVPRTAVADVFEKL